MTRRVLAGHVLAGLTGAAGPPEWRHGAWHVALDPSSLPTVFERLVRESAAILTLIAGEDRSGAGEMLAHYVLGVPGASGEPHDLVHLHMTLDRAAPSVPSLAGVSFPASRFEREMRDMLGIVPVGHPDPRPLMRHGFWPDTFFPLRDDAVVPEFEDDGRPFPFTPVAGDGIYEIPVGPVHAGVIEPGHFRFSVLGETIVKMRARLYFTHKGTETLMRGRRAADAVALAERVSGDTSVGHALALCQAVESLSAVEIPEAARTVRTVLLELERLYNHVTDVGAIVADTGFPVGQAHCLRIREALLRINRQVAGHRLLRGIVAPGGLGRPVTLPPELVADLRRLQVDFDEIVAICLENTLVRDRLEHTGRLSPDVARDFGVVGYVARACGLAADVRADTPFAAYDRIPVTPVVEQTGDVLARLLVRVGEVRQALDVIEVAVSRPLAGPTQAPLGTLAAGTPAFGLVEAWRGRLVHMVVAGADGCLSRVKIVDPSFFNWPALARALDGNIVPDFPLCNKSFNQSYSGNDL